MQDEKQRDAALAKANAIRTAHAALKDDIATDATWSTMYAVLREERKHSGRMVVGVVMLAAPGLGPTVTRRTLRVVGVRGDAKVHELTARQADALVGKLAMYHRDRHPETLERFAATGRPGWQDRVKHRPKAA